MQWLAALLLIGTFVLLLLVAVHLGRTEKMPNRQKWSVLEDFYRSKGLGNVIDAQKKFNELTAERDRSSSSRRHRRARHK
jgi:hypothetical protein